MQAAAWIEGLLRGGALALLHQDDLWRALDGWLAALPGESFLEGLPLLRRAFSAFQPPERRAMGEKLRDLAAGDAGPAAAPDDLVLSRAEKVLPVLRLILLGGRDEG